MNMLTREEQRRQRERIGIALERARAELAGCDPVQPRLSHKSGPERQSNVVGYDQPVGRISTAHILAPKHILAVFDSMQMPAIAPTPLPYIAALRMEGFNSPTQAFRAAVEIRDMMRTKDVSVMVMVFGGPKRMPDGVERASDVTYRGGLLFESPSDFNAWLEVEYPMPPEPPQVVGLHVADPFSRDDGEWRKNHDAEHEAVLRGVRKSVMTVE